MIHYKGHTIFLEPSGAFGLASKAMIYDGNGTLVNEVFTLHNKWEAEKGAKKRIDAIEYYLKGGVEHELPKFRLTFSRKETPLFNILLKEMNNFARRRKAAKAARKTRKGNSK